MCIPRERAVRRTARASKVRRSRGGRASSFGEMAVARPPMTPARATGFSASAITRCCVVSVRRTPSSVTSVSPALARRTTIVGRPSLPFASVSRSKAWSGWPMSQSTWFVASTGAEIGPEPIARSLSRKRGRRGAHADSLDHARRVPRAERGLLDEDAGPRVGGRRSPRQSAAASGLRERDGRARRRPRARGRDGSCRPAGSP